MDGGREEREGVGKEGGGNEWVRKERGERRGEDGWREEREGVRMDGGRREKG